MDKKKRPPDQKPKERVEDGDIERDDLVSASYKRIIKERMKQYEKKNRPN